MSGCPGGGDELVLPFTHMNLMEVQQAPKSAEGEAKVITLCGSTKFEAESRRSTSGSRWKVAS
jgi:hypothetical protein